MLETLPMSLNCGSLFSNFIIETLYMFELWQFGSKKENHLLWCKYSDMRIIISIRLGNLPHD